MAPPWRHHRQETYRWPAAPSVKGDALAVSPAAQSRVGLSAAGAHDEGSEHEVGVRVAAELVLPGRNSWDGVRRLLRPVGDLAGVQRLVALVLVIDRHVVGKAVVL